jgi:hypothetical protein
MAGKYKVSVKSERTWDGIVFDSKSEMKRYIDLKLLQKAGVIRDLQLQPEFKVYINSELFCTYTSDFQYFNNDVMQWITEDVKSEGTMLDAAFKLRKKAAELYHGVKITLVVNGKALTPKRRGRKLKK